MKNKHGPVQEKNPFAVFLLTIHLSSNRSSLTSEQAFPSLQTGRSRDDYLAWKSVAKFPR